MSLDVRSQQMKRFAVRWSRTALYPVGGWKNVHEFEHRISRTDPPDHPCILQEFRVRPGIRDRYHRFMEEIHGSPSAQHTSG
jgi:hypothetical protein